MMDTRSRWLPVLVLASLGLTACGDDTDDAPDVVSATGPGTVTGDLGSTAVRDVPATESPVDPEPPASTGAFSVPIGTQPGFVGAAYTASDFPVKETLPVTPRDAIPAMTAPPMSTSPPPFLRDEDLVFGVVINQEARAYPHNIGWRHEIVNDVVGGHPVCVTFCPLTGTGLVFDGQRADGRLSLGVSGLLYNTNLVMYDRRDGQTLYPQIYASGVNGEVGQTLDLLPVVETTWATWKRLYPQTIAFPFSEMGERASINETVNGFDVLVAYERTATWPSLTRVRWTAVF